MRIVLDLQGAQTEGSRHRGIGRYSLSLALAMAKARGHVDLRVALNANFPAAAAAILDAFDGVLPTSHFSFYRTPVKRELFQLADDPLVRAGEAIVRRHIAEIEPDVLHVSSLFEAAREDFCLTDVTLYPPGIISATLYDLIPLLFRDLYLVNPTVTRFYEQQLAALRSCDLLLAISEATRNDAIHHLGLPPERVVSISGAVDEHFRPLALPAGERDALLLSLGISRPLVLYTGGGDARKNIDGLIAAYACLPADVRAEHQLAVLAPLHEESERRWRKLMKANGLQPDEVVLPGYVPDDQLVVLYNACTLFVFPSLYEGFGLPVLEAMSCGAPAIAGNNSSLPEIVGRSDALFDASSPAAIAAAMTGALRDEGFRRELAQHGLERSREFSWDRSAQLALQAYEEAHRRRQSQHDPRPRPLPFSLLSRESARGELAGALRAAPNPVASGGMIESIVDDLLFSAPSLAGTEDRRLLIDVTATDRFDHRSGIQRVVKCFTRSIYERQAELFARPQAVRLDGRTLVTAERFLGRLFHTERIEPEVLVEIGPRDDLLMLDSSWDIYDDFADSFAQVRAWGGRIYTVVYDLVPLLHPETTGSGMPAAHFRWLSAAAAQSDGLICISRSVADELLTQLHKGTFSARKGLKVGWFHLGSDIPPHTVEATVRPELADLFTKARPSFLMVGTLEPRKAHAVALDAFERLWADGVDASLCILGKAGWRMEALARQLERHPEMGRRLHWVENPTDAEILQGYRSASALVFSSFAEGYGLPIVEAAHNGLPVICSDIPVFREIGGDHALYFAANDPDDLASAVRRFLSGGVKIDPARLEKLTWDGCVHQLLNVIYGGHWYADLADTQARFREHLRHQSSAIRARLPTS